MFCFCPETLMMDDDDSIQKMKCPNPKVILFEEVFRNKWNNYYWYLLQNIHTHIFIFICNIWLDYYWLIMITCFNNNYLHMAIQ